MTISYDRFAAAFLTKVSEFHFLQLPEADRNAMIDGYMKAACSQFKTCKHPLVGNDQLREFDLDVTDSEADELADIISEGMLVQWMKPYVYRAENLENVLNTKDFTSYSPSELLLRIVNAYGAAKKDYLNMVREYSYNHGDLTDLSL